MQKNKKIALFSGVEDSTEQIKLGEDGTIALAKGWYLISYKVSAIFKKPNYMQITPYYNEEPHLESGIYFATSADGSSACGAGCFILEAKKATTLYLYYSGSCDAMDGEIQMTILKLKKA